LESSSWEAAFCDRLAVLPADRMIGCLTCLFAAPAQWHRMQTFAACVVQRPEHLDSKSSITGRPPGGQEHTGACSQLLARTTAQWGADTMCACIRPVAALLGLCQRCHCCAVQIVEHGGYILEKPDDVTHARKMLERCAAAAASAAAAAAMQCSMCSWCKQSRRTVQQSQHSSILCRRDPEHACKMKAEVGQTKQCSDSRQQV
jgi:hypothetical protein